MNHKKNRKLIFWLLLSMFWSVSLLRSQQVFDGRAAGMAFTNSALARGLGTLGGNPALLALPEKFKLEINLFTVNGAISNNSFNKAQYDRYFSSGAFLTEEDKRDILTSIPGDVLKGMVYGKVNLLSFYTRNLSLFLIGEGSGYLNIPKSVVDLLLFGNPVEKERFDLNGLDASGWSGVSAGVSVGLPIYQSEDGLVKFVSGGVTLKYLSGLGLVEVLNAGGEIRNAPEFIAGNGILEVRSARGGSGLGMDVGTYVEFAQKFKAGLTLKNLFGAIRWRKETERHLLNFSTDSLSLPDRIRQEEFVNSDTTFSIGSFTTRLPVSLDLAIGYTFNPAILLSAEIEQGLNRSMGSRKSTRMGIGVEVNYLPMLPLRSGLAWSGDTGMALAIGAGIKLPFFVFDIGYVSHRSFFGNNGKGGQLAITSRLRF